VSGRLTELSNRIHNSPSPQRRQAPVGGEVLLLSAACIAATCSYSTTSAPYNLTAIVLGAIAVAMAVLRFGVGVPRRWALVAALLITLVPQTLRPPSPNVHQTAFYPWSVALGVAAVILLLGSVLPWLSRIREPLVLTGFASMIVALIVTVPGGTRPLIDVWIIFQQSAAGLFHGVNPYEITNFPVPHDQTANCFNYLPATFVSGWLGWVTAGDVRYAEVAVLLAGWLALFWVIVRRTGSRPDTRFTALALLLTAMTLAGSLRVAQQAWNESLILGFLLIAAALLMTKWRGWAWLPFALALATKQHVALLLPLFAFWPSFGWRRTTYSMLGAAAVSAPWVLWDFARFKTCTVDFFVNIEARHDSISLWRFLPQPLQNVAVIGGLLVAFVLAFRYLPKTVGGLLIGSGLVLMGFDLSNKQTFENQWWLFAELIVCGLALQAIQQQHTAPPGPADVAAAQVAA
jgi:hypothetical protein